MNEQRISNMMKDLSPHDQVVKVLSQLISEDAGTYTRDKVKTEERLYNFGSAIGWYMPDVHAPAKKRKGMIDIYEVWCNETREKAYFDIIRSLIYPKTGYLTIVTAYNPEFQWSANDVWKMKKALMPLLAKSYRRS